MVTLSFSQLTVHSRRSAALCAFLAVSSVSPCVRAQSAPELPDELAGHADARAAIVLVGAAREESADFGNVVRELLGARDVAVSLQTALAFEPDQLLASPTERGVSVFVVLRSPHAARLYFRGPGGKRYLIRDLELRNALDDVGRELIGQVVESSVLALLQTSAGMSREEASVTIAAESRAPARTAKEKTSKESALDLAAWIGAGYASVFAGSDIRAQHGPRVELGAAFLPRSLLRVRLAADRYFGVRVDAPELAATLRTSALRGFVDAGPRLGRHTLVLSFGGGVELTHIDPGNELRAAVESRPSRTNSVPLLAGGLRYELSFGHWTLAAGAALDIALLRTHYDLERNGVRDVVARPWIVRPSALLVLAFVPALGGS